MSCSDATLGAIAPAAVPDSSQADPFFVRGRPSTAPHLDEAEVAFADRARRKTDVGRRAAHGVQRTLTDSISHDDFSR